MGHFQAKVIQGLACLLGSGMSHRMSLSQHVALSTCWGLVFESRCRAILTHRSQGRILALAYSGNKSLKPLRCPLRPSGWLRAVRALTSRPIFLAGVKWSCLRINKPAFHPSRSTADWETHQGRGGVMPEVCLAQRVRFVAFWRVVGNTFESTGQHIREFWETHSRKHGHLQRGVRLAHARQRIGKHIRGAPGEGLGGLEGLMEGSRVRGPLVLQPRHLQLPESSLLTTYWSESTLSS